MEKKLAFAIVLTMATVLGSLGRATAGVDPQPFRAEIREIYSIELTLASINRRLVMLERSAILPAVMEGHLKAAARQIDLVSERMEEILAALSSSSHAGSNRGQDEMVRSLDGIKSAVGGIGDIMSRLAARMGVDPVPFKIGSTRIIEDIDFHLVSILSGDTTLFQ